MKKVNFLFGIHCHQPVGNFEHIFDQAYNDSYLPFIQAMTAHPRIKFSIHYSGILYDWFSAKHPEFFDSLNRLVKRGQAEVLTAGYYEPILPMVPDEDKLGQINLSNEFIKNKFGVAPRGLWLTERIWEPQLPKILAKTGVEYLTVDDYHFLSAGVPPEKMLGYYVTEDEGSILKIFPINKQLRYLIPFKLPEETIKYLQELADESGQAAAILADDGEKFGVWPGTRRWVFEEGYLEKLLTALEENCHWINFINFSEYLDTFPPLGRVYLPTASYSEMMEWALPTASGKKLEKIKTELKHQRKWEEYSQFFKGGFFRNFLTKYPEANNMHKKMLQVSQRLQTLKKGKSLIGESEREARLREATIELYKGQCNCAYWHGVFGGLYLNYLRQAVYEHLIKAECLMDKYARGKDDFTEIVVTDFDKDGQDEVVLANSLLNLYFAPHYGGGLFELDYKPKQLNLIDSLARREETYHAKVKEAANQSGQAGHGSIHEGIKLKEPGLDTALIYDWHRRISLLDHLLDDETDFTAFSRVAYQEAGDFTDQPYEFIPQKRGNEITLVMRRTGQVKNIPVKTEKHVSVFAKQSIVNVVYELINAGKTAVNFRFGTEFNFSLLAGRSADRYFEIDNVKLEDKFLASSGITEGISTVKLIDEWKGFSVLLEFDKPAELWRFPIETVSQSESGLEKTYQSSVVFPNWLVSLAPGERWKVKIVLRIED